jgi:hypothetical protein
MARVLDLAQDQLYQTWPLDSLLAREYWEPYDGTLARSFTLMNQVTLRALVEEYCGRFGEEPNWWVLVSSTDQAYDLREAIRTCQPIVLNIPPDCVA